MLISHSKKFIFIHTYKTAGTSIRNGLLRYSDFSIRTKNPLKLIKYATGQNPLFYSNSLPAHSTAIDIKEHLGDKFHSYYSFAFVRNPWDWQVSLYTYMLKEKSHFQHQKIVELGDFTNYIRWRCEEEVRFQKDFLCNKEGEVLVDFIGRFESLQEDFNTITKSIGIKNIKLQHLNQSRESDYRKFYTTETSDLVKETFRKDIEFFNYEF